MLIVTKFSVRKLVWLLLSIVLLWLGTRFVLPVALPFLLGTVLAFAAEPMVDFLVKKGKLPRPLAAGVGIVGVLIGIITLFSVAGAAVIREIGMLAQALPDLEETAKEGMALLQNTLTDLAQKSPKGVRPLLTGAVSGFFSDGTAVMKQVTGKISGMVSSFLGAVPDGVLGVGTGLIAGFMISVRLPKLRTMFSKALPEKWRDSYLPNLQRVRGVLWGWLKAQLLLCFVTFCIVTVGFLWMGIAYAPAWAILVAVVDAVPLLGTGTVLVPCALVSLLQGEGSRALFYLGIYALSATARAVLEPKLLGKHLGIDPLLTLVAIYTGYRFWGLTGLIFAPMTISAIMQILNAEKL